MKWLQKLFDNRVQQNNVTQPSKGLSAEQQQALCLSLQKLQYIALGARSVTLPGESPKFEVSQQTAKWAVPYAERILDAQELFQRGDIRGALSVFLSLPEAAIIQMNIGVCYAELGEKQEAESWLRKSIDSMPPSHRGMLEENFRRLQIQMPSGTKVTIKAPEPTPAHSIGQEELDSLVHELLMIDLTEGLMQVESGSSSNQLTQRHKRGREIGEILCNSGGNKLMVRAAKDFVSKGGGEWNLSHCWHNIKDRAGNICWMA